MFAFLVGVGIACIVAAVVGGSVKVANVLSLDNELSARRQVLLGVLGIILVGLAFVVGHTNTNGHGESTELSHQELVSRFNAACGNYHREVHELPPPGSGLQATAIFLGRVLPIIHSFLRQLQSLKPQPSDAAEYDRLVHQQTEYNLLATELRNTAEQGNQRRVHAINKEGAKLESAINETAGALGFSVNCSLSSATG
jgi:hypothetical protein